eukprot:scaffold188645_cov14-Tisochrysis_lutea.AAC.1
MPGAEDPAPCKSVCLLRTSLLACPYLDVHARRKRAGNLRVVAFCARATAAAAAVAEEPGVGSCQALH